MTQLTDIKNRKAFFEYEFLEKFTAGMVLTGTEIKSIRGGQVNMSDAWCYLARNELYVKNLNISAYEKGTHYNHEPLRIRKLLLTGRELKKVSSRIKEKGLTLVPVRLYISERGLAKLEIALARGKKTHDKRESIKDREAKRNLKREEAE